MNKSSKSTNHSILQQEGLRSSSIGYMPGLDGLRTLAVFSVIAYHLNLSWTPGGLLGVSLFFVLSGYLITNILLKQWEGNGSIDWKDFWIRRARRLLPALFTMLAGVMAWIAIFAPDRLGALKQEVLAAIFYTSNWYLIFHQVSYFESFGPPSPFGHLWSLAVEEQFYLLWPLLLGLGLRYLPKRKWVIGGTGVIAISSVAAMTLIYMPGYDPSRVYYGTDTRAFALLVGALIAMIWPSGSTMSLSGRKRLALDMVGSTGLLVVILMIWRTNQYQTFLYQGGLLLFSAAAACLIVALSQPESYLNRLFGLSPLRWLGECSYGIYLWHYPVIILTSPAVDTGTLDIWRAFWQIAASILLAALSRYLIEEPIRYGRWKRYRRRSSDLSHRKLLVSLIKISTSLFLIFFILIVNANEGMQISAEDLSENQITREQTQSVDEEIQTPSVDEVDQISVVDESGQTNSTGETAETSQTQAQEREEQVHITGDGITAIGDSLMMDVEPVLQKSLPGIIIEGKIGRQMHQAPDVISKLQKEGGLGKVVIIELGTNGSFTEKQLRETLDSLNEAEQIVLVNTRVPRPWETAVNETLSKVSESYPNSRVIDWFSASSGHDDYFYPDGVHLNQTGSEAYGAMIVEALISIQDGK